MSALTNNSVSPVPAVGQVFSIVLLMSTVAVLAACVTQRLLAVRSWRRLQLTNWLLFAIYIDSFAFVFLTAVLTKGFNMNATIGICHGVILLCLFFYMTTKVLLYLFLVERAYVVRGRSQPRLKNKLYLFNFGMIAAYVGIFILNFIFRFSFINSDGLCIVGMRRIAMIPLLSFEVLVNIYLTSLFLLPLRRLYSYKHKTNANLRVIALRTFVGSCATLMSSAINITVLLVLEGEPGWVCMMCCNSDILFSVLVLHWVTSVDKSRPSTPHQYKTSSRRKSDKPYDGTNAGTLTAKRQSKGDGLMTPLDETAQQQTMVTTFIEADVEAEHPKNTPIDRIAVTTERMTHVEFETDIVDEFSPGSSKVEKRFQSDGSEGDEIIGEAV